MCCRFANFQMPHNKLEVLFYSFTHATFFNGITILAGLFFSLRELCLFIVRWFAICFVYIFLLCTFWNKKWIDITTDGKRKVGWEKCVFFQASKQIPKLHKMWKRKFIWKLIATELLCWFHLFVSYRIINGLNYLSHCRRRFFFLHPIRRGENMSRTESETYFNSMLGRYVCVCKIQLVFLFLGISICLCDKADFRLSTCVCVVAIWWNLNWLFALYCVVNQWCVRFSYQS